MEHAHQRSWPLALGCAVALALGSAPAALAVAAESATARAGDFRDVARIERLTEVGHGTLHWFGVTIYRATLRSANGRFSSPTVQPLSLTLTYQHRITRRQLIDITAGEWARLGLADEPTRRGWAATLEGIWSDVEAGDEISVLVAPAASTRFYRGDRLLGQIEDPAFGPAYLAIWFDARSQVGRLRTDLMGSTPDGRP